MSLEAYPCLMRSALKSLLACAACAAGLSGCTLSGGGANEPRAKSHQQPPALAEADPNPFRAVSMRIHPLTHVDAQAGGPCTIELHFELLDRFGDSVKSPGVLRVELTKPASGSVAGMETRELSWELPELVDADENFKRFDTPTRTYRVPLVAPAWVGEMLAKKSARLTIRASMELPGVERPVRDDYVIQ
jgi:hypothetical protein